MKRLLAVLVILFVSMSAALAQKTTKAVISTPTVQCDMCKQRIENYVSRNDGVTAIVVDVKKKKTTVTFWPDRINIEEIKALIATAGYDADDVTADEESYKKLPKCCKRPEIKKDTTKVAGSN